MTSVTEDLLGYFGSVETIAGAHYKRFVEEGMESGAESPLKQVYASTFLGNEDFIEKVRKAYLSRPAPDTRNVPALRRVRTQPSFDRIAEIVGSVVKRGGADFRKWSLLVCQEFGGYALNEIGARYGMAGSAVSQSNRRLRAQVSKEPKMRAILAEVGERLRC